MLNTNHYETAVLGGGCFWCIEAVFNGLRGVVSAESGYSGGSVPDPTYEQVCTGTTSHAESVRITFDPGVISFADILRVFFTVHDPTTLNRQGNDTGTQYRSVIFFMNESQKKTSMEIMSEIDEKKIWDRPLVTELSPFKVFYPAEDYHRGYFSKNPDQPYCRVVIAPKVAKFRKLYHDRLKKESA